MQKYELGMAGIYKTSAGKLNLNDNIEFYERGDLKGGHLSEPQIIETPGGNLKLYGDLWFHRSGGIKIICLNEKVQIAGRTFTEETKIGWDDKGDFLGGMDYDVILDDFVQKKS